MPATLKKLPKVKTWTELFGLANDQGDNKQPTEYAKRWQKVIVCALSNLGNSTLRPNNPKHPRLLWLRAYDGLQEYISALVGEYGQSETKAEREVLAEVNHVRHIAEDIKLED